MTYRSDAHRQGSRLAPVSAKPAPWYLNAARRTLQASVPALARPDDDWASGRLTAAQRGLYLRLPAQERAHGVEVARRLLTHAPDASADLVAAALLHDVGKLGTPQFVLWRVLTHLLPLADLPSQPRLRGLAGARQARRHHPEYGAALIRAAGAGTKVAALVAAHHDLRAQGDAARLRAADEHT